MARRSWATRNAAAVRAICPTAKAAPKTPRVAGLSVSYIMRQLQDFRSGRRRSADPRKPNTNTMIDLAKALDDDELKAAAEYFGSLPGRPGSAWWKPISCQEPASLEICFFRSSRQRPNPSARASSKFRRTRNRRRHCEIPAWALWRTLPPGSIARGKELVVTGGAKVVGNQFIRGKATPASPVIEKI
jgi:hypothetical protein